MSSTTFWPHHSGRAEGTSPTVVLVHGWPDSAAMWDPVARQLDDTFHVVTLDMPGVGRAPAPTGVPHPYRLDQLARALDTVIEGMTVDQPVHLVGHDWGGVLGWRYLMTPELGDRLASFTTLSGPSLDHMGLLLRRSVEDRRLARIAAGQLIRSWYTLVLSVPVLRTALWRLGGASALRWVMRRGEDMRGYPGNDLAHNAAATVPLYRSNIAARLCAPTVREIRVPVHVIVAERDRFVSPAVMRSLDRWVPDLEVSDIDAGHWAPRSHPDTVASLITAWVRDVDRSRASGNER